MTTNYMQKKDAKYNANWNAIFSNKAECIFSLRGFRILSWKLEFRRRNCGSKKLFSNFKKERYDWSSLHSHFF